MTKYKLEYIWLDGYTPVPNLRGKTQIKEFDSFPTLEQLPLWGFDGSSTMQAEGQQLGLRAEAGRASIPDADAQQRRAGHVRSHDAGRQDAAPVQQARHHPRRRRRLVRLRAGILLLQGRPPARLPREPAIRRRRARTTPASATRTSATSPARSSRSISTSASPPASTTKASTPKWRRASGNSRSSARAPRRAADEIWMARYLHAAPHREIRHRHRVPLQAARRHRLERLRHALPTSRPSTCAKSAARTTSRR